MKIWTKVKLTDKNKDVEEIAKSLTNYFYGYGPIIDITRKYHIKPEDRKILDQYTANRIAGILMLYLAKDTKRINDIKPVFEEEYYVLGNGIVIRDRIPALNNNTEKGYISVRSNEKGDVWYTSEMLYKYRFYKKLDTFTGNLKNN